MSTFSRLITSSTPCVIKPLLPYEPSSVIITTSSLYSRTCSSRIIRSFVRPARIETTRLPASFIALIIGNIGATPTPPPAHTTVPNFSICVAFPRGPTKSRTSSPTFKLHNFVDDTPIFCTTSVIVPRATSESAIVKGIRSPSLSTRTITK